MTIITVLMPYYDSYNGQNVDRAVPKLYNDQVNQEPKKDAKYHY